MATSPAAASFHLMQIEQVIGGVNGDTSLQAIQLRMRSLGQNLVSDARLRAWDASGANPVLILDIGSDVANDAVGSRVLITSPGFAAAFPTPTANFTMTNLIPASYLTAGKLTFESDAGPSTGRWRGVAPPSREPTPPGRSTTTRTGTSIRNSPARCRRPTPRR